jgi:hypothetical protein
MLQHTSLISTADAMLGIAWRYGMSMRSGLGALKAVAELKGMDSPAKAWDQRLLVRVE